METQYAALIVDVVGSRKLDRVYDLVRHQIALSLGLLNFLYEDGIEFPVVFSDGDSPQGLFKNRETAALYFRFLSLLLPFSEIRGGIGWGTRRASVSVGNSRSNALWEGDTSHLSSSGQDGQAYHRARKAVEAAHRLKSYKIVVKTDDRRFLSREDTMETVLLDHSACLIASRTAVQKTRALLVELLFPLAPENRTLVELHLGRERARWIAKRTDACTDLDERQKASRELEDMERWLDDEVDRACSSYAQYLYAVDSFLEEYRYLMNTLIESEGGYSAQALRAISNLDISLHRDGAIDELVRLYRRQISSDSRGVNLQGGLQGLTYVLADLLETSRPSLDKRLHMAHVVQERNAAQCYCEYLRDWVGTS